MNRVFLLDRSGSMQSCWDDTIGGYNSFLEGQKGQGGTMTLIQFDHETLESYKDVPIDEVKPLDKDTYCPRGSTALLDAIGKVIKDGGDNRIVIILTDGYENASHTYTKAHIKDLITNKEKEGWQFMYLGANQDAFAEGESMGIAPGRTLNFDVNKTPQLFATLSAAVSHASQNGTPVEL